MREIFIESQNMALKDFIKLHREKIDSLAIRNYTISKNDEWRNEDCWDKRGGLKC